MDTKNNLDHLWKEYREKREQRNILAKECEQVLKQIAKVLCTCYHVDTDEWSWEYCGTRMTGNCLLFKQQKEKG